MNLLRHLLLSSLLSLAPLAAQAESGAEMYQEITKGTPPVQNEALVSYINDLGQELARATGRSDIKFTFTVLDSPDINAFAIKDGYIFVNRGLLNLLQSEAQIAAVLGHEIGHVTGNHLSRTNTKATTGMILAQLAAVLSGSADVYEATTLWANSLISGYGRNLELEADELGAEYLYKAGYDPMAMLQTLSLLKDYEELLKDQSRGKGGPVRTYHGLFASHPRSDARLRTVVSRAKKYGEQPTTKGDRAAEYRRATDNLIWGVNFDAKKPKESRYSDMDLRVRFDYPEDWTFTPDKPSVTGKPENGEAVLTMEPKRRTLQSPEEYLHNYLDVGKVEKGKEIAPARLKGYTAIIPASGSEPKKRIAVIYYKLNAYIFTGTVEDESTFDEYDKLFQESIATFRPISKKEVDGQKPRKMRWVKATGGTTFDRLAEELFLDEEEKMQLRLINGYYPKGEPVPGQWIKIIQR